MTFADPNSRVERARCWISRAAVVVVTILLAIGVGLTEMHQSGSVAVLETACAILLAVPILNAIAALLEEVGRRDWPFVGAGVLVLGLVAYSVLEKMQ
jgi:uncharacterized membrane protein YhaH (DUF805 family)